MIVKLDEFTIISAHSHHPYYFDDGLLEIKQKKTQYITTFDGQTFFG